MLSAVDFCAKVVFFSEKSLPHQKKAVILQPQLREGVLKKRT